MKMKVSDLLGIAKKYPNYRPIQKTEAELAELGDALKVFQETPVLIGEDTEGNKAIINGYHRIEAAMIVGMEELEVSIKSIDSVKNIGLYQMQSNNSFTADTFLSKARVIAAQVASGVSLNDLCRILPFPTGVGTKEARIALLKTYLRVNNANPIIHELMNLGLLAETPKSTQALLIDGLPEDMLQTLKAQLTQRGKPFSDSKITEWVKNNAPRLSEQVFNFDYEKYLQQENLETVIVSSTCYNCEQYNEEGCFNYACIAIKTNALKNILVALATDKLKEFGINVLNKEEFETYKQDNPSLFSWSSYKGDTINLKDFEKIDSVPLFWNRIEFATYDYAGYVIVGLNEKKIKSVDVSQSVENLESRMTNLQIKANKAEFVNFVKKHTKELISFKTTFISALHNVILHRCDSGLANFIELFPEDICAKEILKVRQHQYNYNNFVKDYNNLFTNSAETLLEAFYAYQEMYEMYNSINSINAQNEFIKKYPEFKKALKSVFEIHFDENVLQEKKKDKEIEKAKVDNKNALYIKFVETFNFNTTDVKDSAEKLCKLTYEELEEFKSLLKIKKEKDATVIPFKENLNAAFEAMRSILSYYLTLKPANTHSSKEINTNVFHDEYEDDDEVIDDYPFDDEIEDLDYGEE